MLKKYNIENDEERDKFNASERAKKSFANVNIKYLVEVLEDEFSYAQTELMFHLEEIALRNYELNTQKTNYILISNIFSIVGIISLLILSR